MSESASYKQILKSSSIIGGASVINILIGLIRLKVIALMFGPAGIGFLALLTNIMQVASTIAAMGMNNVGTRQIAEASAKDDERHIAVAAKALLLATAVLSIVGGISVWLLRESIALWVFSDPNKASAVGLVGVAVFLSVVAGSQGALLNGLRRIGDMARVSMGAAFLSTSIALPILWWGGESMIPVVIIITPLMTLLLSYYYTKKLKPIPTKSIQWKETQTQIKTMLKLGGVFMLAGLVGVAGLLVVRSIIQQKLGIAAVGIFEAAWMISMTYLGFVLGAMGADYYPRLTAVIHNHEEANRLANQQTEVVLLLAGPVLIAMMALAPWVIQLLYSQEFSAATNVLLWQIMGDALKIVSWPLGFMILAAGRGNTFLFSELTALTVFCLVVWLGIDYFGLISTGFGFFVMYLIYLPLVYIIASKQSGFTWSRSTVVYFISLVTALAVTGIVSIYSDWVALLIGFSFAVLGGIYGFKRLAAHLPVLKSFYNKLNVYRYK